MASSVAPYSFATHQHLFPRLPFEFSKEDSNEFLERLQELVTQSFSVVVNDKTVLFHVSRSVFDLHRTLHERIRQSLADHVTRFLLPYWIHRNRSSWIDFFIDRHRVRLWHEPLSDTIRVSTFPL